MNKKQELSRQDAIENRIFTIRGIHVMIDRDLSDLYGVATKRLNEQVKRNKERFPFEFCFQLTENEKNELVANCDRFENLKHSTTPPYAFTEQGVAMLSVVIRSDMAVMVSIKIMNAFVTMRRFLLSNAQVFQRLEKLELKQIDTDHKIDKVLSAIERREIQPKQGIFFNGQVFDAWQFVSDLVRSAKRSIVLIDNYLDDSVLALFEKREKGVSVVILTKKATRQMELDVKKFNEQYPSVSLKEFTDSHDRFIIIDNECVYHIGASLKDLGKKWFAFSRMEIDAIQMISKLGEGGTDE